MGNGLSYKDCELIEFTSMYGDRVALYNPKSIEEKDVLKWIECDMEDFYHDQIKIFSKEQYENIFGTIGEFGQ